MTQANVNIDVTEIWLDPEVDEVVAEVAVAAFEGALIVEAPAEVTATEEAAADADEEVEAPVGRDARETEPELTEP